MSSGEHVTEDRLEGYCLGTVSTEDLEPVESHLLICEECRGRLHETEVFVQAFREAATRMAAEDRRPVGVARWVFRPGAVAACAAVVAVALLWKAGPAPWISRVAAPAAIALDSARGGEEPLRRAAPARTPLVLRLDLTGLPALDSYRVRLVDARGTPVFESDARPENGRLVPASMPRLAQGNYWIRIYGAGESGAPLREFGLTVR